jgi:competence protein ComFC
MSALEGMFESQATEWIEERQILIVDDVITTGATIKSMAKELKQAGAATVSAVALAHTESSFW